MILVAPTAFAQGIGSQSLSVSGNCAILALILGSDSAVSGLDSSSPGPDLAVGYRFALKPALDVGADTGLILLGTKVGQSFLVVPLTASGRWTLSLRSFEFPIDFGVGIAYSRYDGISNLDPVLDLRLGAGYRISKSITVGLDINNLLLVQWFHQDSSQNKAGYFPGIGLFGSYRWDHPTKAP
jgi:hypothetical protein